jgi:hypothetical protein
MPALEKVQRSSRSKGSSGIVLFALHYFNRVDDRDQGSAAIPPPVDRRVVWFFGCAPRAPG